MRTRHSELKGSAGDGYLFTQNVTIAINIKFRCFYVNKPPEAGVNKDFKG